MTLLRQHARSEAISTLIWAIVLGFTGFITVYMWEIIVSTGQMEQLQKALEGAEGMLKALVAGGDNSLLSMDGWMQGYVLGGWVTLPYVIYTALFVAGMITREMDRRTIEFVLSLPVSRTQLLVSRWLVLAGSLTAVNLVYLVGVLVGVAALGEAGHPGRYTLAVFNSLLLYLFLGTLMLLISLFIDDYGVGSGVMLGVGLGLNFFHMGTSDSAGVIKTLHDALPFSWFDVQSIVIHGKVPWGDMALLAGGTLILLALSVWVFQRKQIAV